MNDDDEYYEVERIRMRIREGAKDESEYKTENSKITLFHLLILTQNISAIRINFLM